MILEVRYWYWKWWWDVIIAYLWGMETPVTLSTLQLYEDLMILPLADSYHGHSL